MTIYPDDPRLGDVVKFRKGQQYVLGKVVRQADASDRLQVEVVEVGQRTSVRNFTVHLDDAAVVKRSEESEQRP